MAKYKILSTKQLLPPLVEDAAKNNIEIVQQEFISIQPIWSKEISNAIVGMAQNGIRTIALTSSNAVEILDKYMHQGDTYYVVDWKICCLSGKTKKAVQQAVSLGENIVAEAENASALARKIIYEGIKEIIFLCGNKRRDELPNALKSAGIIVHEIVLYETTETPQIITDDTDGILFFSPSAVQSFFSVNTIKEETVCFAIGNTTADTITDFTDNRVIISEHPNNEMMLASVKFYFEHKSCFPDL